MYVRFLLATETTRVSDRIVVREVDENVHLDDARSLQSQKWRHEFLLHSSTGNSRQFSVVELFVKSKMKKRC